jgi:hypothetical protein
MTAASFGASGRVKVAPGSHARLPPLDGLVGVPRVLAGITPDRPVLAGLDF